MKSLEMNMPDTCCAMMAENINYRCPDHPDPFDCPDCLVSCSDGRYGIIIHDGGRSRVEIRYCPWCGADLEALNAKG